MVIVQALMTAQSKDIHGKPVFQKFPIGQIGVHRKNRAGVYPAGLRCQSLCTKVVPNGWQKEEATRRLLAVEEPPVERIRDFPADYVSSARYNADKCKRDKLLATCFDQPYDDVRASLLAHNHTILIVRAFLTRAH